jgi:hypothetical protein
MSDKMLSVSEDYLVETYKFAAKKCVGELLANIETIKDLSELKITVKNTVYQNFRDLQAQVNAFDCGVKFVAPRPIK